MPKYTTITKFDSDFPILARAQVLCSVEWMPKCLFLISGPDQVWDTGASYRLARKCTLRLECRRASDWFMIACQRAFIGNTNRKPLVQYSSRRPKIGRIHLSQTLLPISEGLVPRLCLFLPSRL